ncbi:MAG: DUF362 domain-containing protein [Planctomycetes bacterium]|nr:DUF362 domain-containing protein [Planctomycetota bacterium]
MNRRDFLVATGAGALGASLLSSSRNQLFAETQTQTPQAVWVENGEPAQLLAAALKEMGGMSQFVSRGDVVVVKPNMAWDRAPEYAANTNPELVAAVVAACLDAGAKTVKVFDRTCNNPLRSYANSQIEDKATNAGADVSQVRDSRFVNKAIDGELVKEWPIYKDYLEADKVINVPIAKHHSLAKVTLGMKNLMGVMGGNRGDIHDNFAQRLVDIDRTILPTLTIIDAYRILTANGPVGGNLAHVKQPRTLIMSPCIVAADYVALELFGLGLGDAGFVGEAVKRGLNKYDVGKLDLRRVRLA